jgi:hypothetical protein
MNAIRLSKEQAQFLSNKITRDSNYVYSFRQRSNIEEFRQIKGAYFALVCSPFVVHIVTLNSKLQLHFHNHTAEELQSLINIAVLQRTPEETKLDLCGCAQLYFCFLSKFWKEKYPSEAGIKYFTERNNTLDISLGFVSDLISHNARYKEIIKFYEKPRKSDAVSVNKGFKENLVETYNKNYNYAFKPSLDGYKRSLPNISISYSLDVSAVEFTAPYRRDMTITLPYDYYIKFHKQCKSLIKRQLVLSILKDLPDGKQICKVLRKLKGPHVIESYALVEFKTDYCKFLTEDEANSYLTFNKRTRKPRSANKKSLDIQAYMQSLNENKEE